MSKKLKPVIPVTTTGGGNLSQTTGLTPTVPRTGPKASTDPDVRLRPVITPETMMVDPSLLPSQHEIDVEKYKKYVPLQDVFVNSGLDDARARGQSRGEKWRNGLIKFGGKTGIITLGGTLGTLASVVEMFDENKNFYDNANQRMLDRWMEGLDEALPNYYTREEQEAGFFKSLGSANFWANDVLGAASFTAGAVLTELIWSAATAATLGAAAGMQGAATTRLLAQGARYIKGLSRAEDMTSAIRSAARTARAGAAGRIVRQTFTGAGYEAGFEARHHKHELMEQMKAEYFIDNPDATSVPLEELRKMDSMANTSANGVFAANMVVVGLSNMVGLSQLYGPKLRETFDLSGLDKIKTKTKLFSPITKSVDDTVEGARKYIYKPAYENHGRLRKLAGNLYTGVKNPLVEGVWEEGMQGVANNSMLDYTTKKYSAEGTDQVVSLVESFGEAIAEQYGESAGWKEMGIGMIVGGIGSANLGAFMNRKSGEPKWVGGVVGAFRDRKEQRENSDRLSQEMNKYDSAKLINFLKENSDHLKNTKATVEHMIRTGYLNGEFNEAVKAEDTFETKNVQDDIIHSFIMSRIEGGYGADLKEELGDMIDEMSTKEFQRTFGYTVESTQELEDRKRDAKDVFESRIDMIQEAVNNVTAAYKGDLSIQANRDKRESLIYATSVIERTEERENQLAEQIREETGVIYDPQNTDPGYMEQYVKEVNAALKGKDTKKKAVKKMVKDLPKLRRRRELYINQYNYLLTKEGQEEYDKLLKGTAEVQQDKDSKKRLNRFKGTRYVRSKNTGNRYKKYNRKDDSQPMLVEVDEEGRTIGEPQEIELDDEFLNDYEEEVRQAEDVVPYSKEDSDVVIELLSKVKNINELNNFIEDDVRPRNLPEDDPVIKAVKDAHKRITGREIPYTLLTDINYRVAVYKDKTSPGRTVVIIEDLNKPDTFYVKRRKDRFNIGNNLEVLTRDEVEEKYILVDDYEQYELSMTRKGNLKSLIKSKKGLIGENKKENKKLKDEYDLLVEEVRSLTEEVERKESMKEKGDKRITKNGINKVKKALQTAHRALEATEAKIRESIEAQRELQLNLQYLLNRVNEEKALEDTETPATTKAEKKFFSKKADDIIEEIETNQQTISQWKVLREKILDVINRLLELVNLGTFFKIKSNAELLKETEDELREDLADDLAGENEEETVVVLLEKTDKKYNEDDPDSFVVDGRRWVPREVKVPPSAAKIRKALLAKKKIRETLESKAAELDRIDEAAEKAYKDVTVEEKKLDKLNEEINVLEEIVQEQYITLDFIDEEVQELEKFRKAQIGKHGGFTSYANMEKGESERSHDENDDTTAEHDDSTREPMTAEQAEAYWKEELKRSIYDVFGSLKYDREGGLTGRHVMDDGTLNPDPAQRRYYSWVTNTNIAAGEYRIQLVRPPKQERERIAKDTEYEADDILFARVLDSKGRFVRFDPVTGKASTSKKFNPRYNVYTSFPLKIETKIKGKRYFQPTTAEGYTRFFGKPTTVQQGEKKFKKIEKRVLREHNELRGKITDLLDSDQKVYIRLKGKSLGIPNDPNADQPLETRPNISVADAFNHDNVQVAVNNLDTLSMGTANIDSNRKGATFIYDVETGNVFEAKPRRVNETEIDMIVNVFRLFAMKSKIATKKDKAKKIRKGQITSFGASALELEDGTEYKNGFQVIQDFVYWTSANRKYNKKTGKWEKVHNNPSRQFHFDKEGEDFNGGSVRLGLVENVPIFMLEEDGQTPILDDNGNLQINPALADENGEGLLRDFLREQTVNINSAQLKADTAFFQTLEVNPVVDAEGNVTGVVKARSIPIDEGGYVKFLTTDTYGERLIGVATVENDSRVIGENWDETEYDEKEPQVHSQYAKYESDPERVYTDIADVPEGVGVVDDEVADDTTLTEEEEELIDDEGEETELGVTTITTPTTKYDRLGALNPGDKIYVQYESEDGETVSTAVLRMKENKLLALDEGNISTFLLNFFNNGMRDLKSGNRTPKQMKGYVDFMDGWTMLQYQNRVFVADVATDAPAKERVKKKEQKETKKKKEKKTYKTDDDTYKEVNNIADKINKRQRKTKGGKKPPPDKSRYRERTDDYPGLTENFEKSRAWFKERFPHRSFTQVRRLANGNQGRLINGAVEIVMNAEVGTTYHEAFHIVTQHVLNRRERRTLYREWRRRNPDQASLSNDVVEEHLAEDFRDFMLSKEMRGEEAESFIAYQTPVQRSIFQRILDGIQWILFGDPVTIEEVFMQIVQNDFIDDTDGANFYREIAPMYRKKVAPLSRTLPEKTERFTKDILEGVNFYFFDQIKDNVSIMYDKKDNAERIQDIYDQAHDNFIDNADEIQQRIAETEDPLEKERLLTTMYAIDYALENWDEAQGDQFKTAKQRRKHSVVGLHKHYLSKFNLSAITTDDILSEIEKSRDPDNVNAREAIKISSKISAPKNIKLLLAGITQKKIIYDEKGEEIGTDYVRNRFEFPKVVSFGEIFNVLANRLSGEITIESMMTTIDELSEELPYMADLAERFGLNKEVSDITISDITLQTQFFQTFAKAYNHFNMNISGPNGAFVAFDANQNSITQKIKMDWRNASADSEYIKLNKEDIPVYDKEKFKDVGKINNFDKATSFLKRLGITFTNPNEFTDAVKAEITNRAGVLRKAIREEPGGQVWLFDVNNDTDAVQDLGVILDAEASASLDYMEHSHINANGDPVYNITDHNYFSLLLGDLKRVNTYGELIEANPHLATNADPYNEYSLLLEPGGIIFDENGDKRGAIKNSDGEILDILTQPIGNFTHSESKEDVTNTARAFEDLGPADQLSTFINYALENRPSFPLIRPSDSAQERFIQFHRLFFTSVDISEGGHIEQMIDYFRAELKRSANNSENQRWLNTSKNMNAEDHGNKGIMVSILYSDESFASDLNAFFEDSSMTVEEFIDNPRTKDNIRDAFRRYVDSNVNSLRDRLIELNIIEEIRNDENVITGYINNSLNIRENQDKKNSPQLETITPNRLNSELLRYTVNDMISNVEQTKVIFSDPINYKSVKDQFKRNYGVISPKKVAGTYNKLNKWIESNLLIWKNGKQVPYFRYDRFGFRKPVLRTAVFADIIVHSDYYAKYAKYIGKSSADFYNRMAEADGQGYIIMAEWRQLLLRAGAWTAGFAGSLEDLYQYEAQKANGIAIPRDPATKRIIDPETLPLATPLKPQHMGPLAEAGHKMGMYKLSLMPLIPSVTQEFGELDKLRRVLEAQNIGVGVFHTGVKTEVLLDPKADDTSNRLQTMYNDQGEIDTERLIDNYLKNPDNKENQLHFQDTYYKYWGIQQEMGNTRKRETVTGSQMMKQILNGIFENGGFAKGKEELGAKAEEYKQLNRERIRNGIKLLTDGLGLELVTTKKGKQKYKIKDIDMLTERFTAEANRRDDPDNILDAIESLKADIKVDMLVNRERLENIMLGIANRLTISQKRFGGSPVQVSVGVAKTKRELLTRFKDRGQVWKSSDLKTYDITKDGKTVTRAQIYLPYHMGFLKEGMRLSDIDPKLLRGMGFRIPTQGLNSIEAFEIAGFLPKAAGDAVMLPSEVVAKTGSDFDIDKLFMYLPNFFRDAKGVPTYIEYTETDEETEALYSKYESDQFKNTVRRVVGTAKAASFIGKELDKIVRKLNETGENVTVQDVRDELAARRDKMVDTSQGEFNIAIDVLNTMITEGETEPFIMSQNEFRKRQIENKISEVQQDIVLHPSNFSQLVNPISAKTLSKEAEAVRRLRYPGNESNKDMLEDRREDPPMHTLIERVKLLEMGAQFVNATRNIGTTAITSTFDIMCKMHGIYMPEYLVSHDSEADPIPTNINMPHNQTEDGLVSLSQIMDSSGEYNIPEMLSQWINASVDAMEDAFMFDLNAGRKTLSTWLYLTMAGVPLPFASRFMNQPIVREYLESLDSWQSQAMRSNSYEGNRKSKFKNTKDVQDAVRGKYVAYLKSNGVSAERGQEKEMTIKDLEADIVRGERIKRNKQPLENAMYVKRQLAVLDDFIRYMASAETIRQATAALDYDTNGAGKNTSEMMFKTTRTDRAIAEQILPNYDKIFSDEGFIQPYFENVKMFSQMFDPLFKHLNNKHLNTQFNKLFNILMHHNNTLPDVTKVEVMDKFKWELSGYILSTQKYKLGKTVDQTMSSQIEKLFYGKKSIAKKLDAIRKKEHSEGRDYQLLRAIQANKSERKDHPDTLIMNAKRLDRIESNTLTGEWRELFDRYPKFAQELIVATMLQYGIQPGPFTMTQFVPTEMYTEMMQSAMRSFDAYEPEQQKAIFDDFFNQFFIRNYENDDIVPQVRRVTKLPDSVKMYPYIKRFVTKKRFDDNDKAAISRAKRRGERTTERIPVIYHTESMDKQSLGQTIKDPRDKRILTGYQTYIPVLNGEKEDSKERDTTAISRDGNVVYMEDKLAGWDSRTRKNAQADVTLVFAANQYSTGTKNTMKYATRNAGTKKEQRRFSLIKMNETDTPKNKPTDKQIDYAVNLINRFKAKTVNIAGNRLSVFKDKGYKQSQVDSFVREFMDRVLNHPDLNNANITIWSGGQSGADEAGVKAGISTGRNTRVLAPKGFRYSNKNGEVKEGKKGFIDRFNRDSFNQISNESTQPPSEAIDNKMRDWLNKMGIKFENVEQITDREGDPIDAIAKADMLLKVVQVAEGKADITTLPEETAHFLVELLGDEHPLLRAMMNAVEGTNVHNEVVEEYSEVYGNDRVKLLKEAVGKMIAKTVVRKESDPQADRFKTWWQRAWNWLKRQFSKVPSTDIEEDLSAYETAADILLGEKDDIPMLGTLSEEIFYQVSKEEKALSKKIKESFREKRVLHDAELGGYLLAETGQKIRNRVTDIVKRFNAKKYRRSEPGDYELPKLKGTMLHKYMEVIGRAVFNGKPITHAKARKEVIDTLTNQNDVANKEFLGKSKKFFHLTNEQFDELKTGIEGLKKQIEARQKEIDPKGKVEFFPELMIYDENQDLAGTIDLAVVYSNGKVGIYDYKGINNLKSRQDKAFYKEDEYEIQIANYKKILVADYGVTEFAETRIIPLDMGLNNKTEEISRLGMGRIGTKDDRVYLQQIPVDDEMTEDVNLNRSLTKMMNLYKTMAADLRRKTDTELFNKVMDLRRSIHKLQVEKDVRYVSKQLWDLYKDFNRRLKLPQSNDSSLTLDMLDEYRKYVEVFEEFGVDAIGRAKKQKDPKVINMVERLAHKMRELQQQIYQKEIELLTDPNDNVDLTASNKAEGFMGRLFKQLSKFNHPAMKKFAQMMRQVSDERRRRVYNVADDINVKTEELKKWAKGRGMSLQQAFDMILGSKEVVDQRTGKKRTVPTGNLIAQFKPEFHEGRVKANKDGKSSWYLANTNVDKIGGKFYYSGEKKERFEQKRKEYLEHMNKRYPDRKKNKDQNDRYNAAIYAWDSKYNITTNPTSALFNPNNGFIEYLPLEENFSEEYKEMIRPENKPLKDYYDMYVNYNQMFADMTGKDIRRNFVAEIHKDIVERLASSGLSNGLGIKDSILRSIETREYDTVKGTIDPATGKPIPSIPVFYTDKLRARLTKREKAQIGEEIANEGVFEKGTQDFNDELKRRIQRQEYIEGSESKSRDLSRSLLMFAEAAISHELLKENESAALALRDIMKSNLQETDITDGTNEKVINEYTGKAAKQVGVPLSEIEAMDQFIAMYFYGQSTQGKDYTFKDGKYSGTKIYQNIIRYTSAKALGLKPILAAGNLVGITSNYYMMGAEGRHFDQKNMLTGIKMMTQANDKYKLAIQFFEPFVRDMTFRKANDLSARRAVKFFTMDRLMVMHRTGDELIDSQIMMALMDAYGIHEGKFVRTEQIPETGDKRSLIERMEKVDENENKRIVIEGINDFDFDPTLPLDKLTKEQQAELKTKNALYSRFRAMVQSTATGIKGNIPQEDRSLVNATLLGQALMHFRSWIPGLVETRFKGLTYDDVFDDADVGRFRVMFGELTGRTIVPGLKAFATLLGEVAFMNLYNKGHVSKEVTDMFYDKFILDNEEFANISREEFLELRKKKLQGMARELRIMLSFASIVFLSKKVLPEPEDEEDLSFGHKVANRLVENAFRITQRGLLELSFFFSPESVETVLKSPVPSFRVFRELWEFLENTYDETRDVIFGEESVQDKSPRMYYFSKLVPVWTSWTDFWDIWDTWNKERGY